MDKKKRIKELVDTINKHNYNYYTLDSPTIADKQWDDLYEELVKLEKEVGHVMKNSPTQRVGGQILEGFKKHNHEHTLYSLNKVSNFEQLDYWIANTVKKAVSLPEYIVDYKYDGLTLVLIYEDGYLVKAATRGNGFVGEDVTAQVKTMRTVPIQISHKGRLTVQGEGVMKLSSLKNYNKTAKEPLKNARNAVAGAIRNLDPKVTASRKIDFLAYDVIEVDDVSFDTKVEEFDFLKNNKFYIFNDPYVTKDVEEIKKYISNKENSLKELDVLTDGIVIKLNKKSHREELGHTTKFPKFAVAYKFPAQEITTKLRDVKWQVGRTGKVTPIADLEPVELSGAIVKRATLNNYKDIERKNIYINSYVFVRRSNEVIPEVLGMAEKTKKSKKIEKIEKCPSCSAKLTQVGPNLFCKNIYGCKDQIKERISHFSSRDAMNIDGLSSKTIDKLFESGKVKSISDLYLLKKDDLLEIEGFKEKKATNLIQAIKKSKNAELYKFIYSLGIKGVGIKASKDLAKRFKSFDKFSNAKKQDILNMYDLGEKTAQSILEYFENPISEWLLTDLKYVGISIKEMDETKTNKKLNYKKIVLTGTFKTKTRRELTDALESMGASITSTVSKNTDIVLVGENPGSKFDKAKKLDISIMYENELLKLI